MHAVHTHENTILTIHPPNITKTYQRQQSSQPGRNSASNKDFGETVRGPLGWLIHARSGDKGSNANIEFWVRHQDGYEWMRFLLSTEKIKELLAKEYHNGQIVCNPRFLTNVRVPKTVSNTKWDRFELRNIWGVHFLLPDYLDRGVSSPSTYDFLANNAAEFLRCRHVVAYSLPKPWKTARKGLYTFLLLIPLSYSNENNILFSMLVQDQLGDQVSIGAGVVGLASGDATAFVVSFLVIRVIERPMKKPVVVQTWKVVLIHSGP